MKKTLLFILSLICVLYLNAQQTITAEESIKNIQTRQIRAIELQKQWELDNQEYLNNQRNDINKQQSESHKKEIECMKSAEFVFEGVLLKYEVYPFYNINKIEKRISRIFLIKKVFKGALKCGTVEVISIDDSESIGMPSQREKVTIPNKNSVIIFVKTSNGFQFDPLYNIDNVNNKTILTTYKENIGFGEYNNGFWSSSIIENNYITKDSLYNYLRKIDGLNIPKKTIQVQSHAGADL